jgi:hypothetical protein
VTVEPASPAAASALGSARASFDTRGIWRARELGRDGWEEEARLCKRLALDLAGVAGEAWCRAGSPDPRRAGCAVGTVHGFGLIAEGIDQRLALAGSAWLEPELFVHSPAHVVAALACIALGLAGGAVTFLGPGGGEQARRHASRGLRLGRQPVYLVGSYEAVTPAASRRLSSLGAETDPHRAEATFTVLAR